MSTGFLDYVEDVKQRLAEKDQRIAELEQENESYQKLINDICNKHKVCSLKELDEKLKNAIVLKPDRYVIVSNGWKKRVWGIAKIQQEVCDNFIYCSDNYIGCYSPFWQYGEFATKEEAEAKLKELQGE